MNWSPRFSLQRYLNALLTLATVLPLLVVGGGLMLIRIPELERQNAQLAQHEAHTFATRERAWLDALARRMLTTASAVELVPRQALQPLLDKAVMQDDSLETVILADARGHVLGVGLDARESSRRADMLGTDISGTPIWLAFSRRGQHTWSAKYLSIVSGRETLGLATPLDDGRVLIAEMPLSRLLRDVALTDTPQAANSGQEAYTWIVDGHGEVLADSEDKRNVGRLNLGPTLHSRRLADPTRSQRWSAPDGRSFHLAAVYSPELDWYFLARVPAGWQNAAIRSTVLMLATAFLGTLVAGLLLAPAWTRGLARQLQHLVERSRRIGEESPDKGWPVGVVEEINQLSHLLKDMSGRLDARERERAAIFNTAPVPMVVMDVDDGYRIVDANQSWAALYGSSVDEILGHRPRELGLWVHDSDRLDALRLAKAGQVDMECELGTHGGGRILCHITARSVKVRNRQLLIWANEDVAERRANEHALRELNRDLEKRVAERTASLAGANADLQRTLAHLDATRETLVQSEKMAALGSLVAGVAHELNTPLGNSLMATTTLQGEARSFTDEMQQGLRRSALERLLSQVAQATQITQRNLERALDLVSSFKQVAVDQTSAQRRSFALEEVVREIMLTLKPTISRTRHQVTAEIPPDIELDSYPGALGQILTNLVSNALVHGLGEQAGTGGVIRIEAERLDKHSVRLSVRDNGAGIAPDLLPRVFDPFVTTRMGRGGTGLGLNIAYNLARNVLGGGLSVSSAPGHGACFELRMPCTAPVNGSQRAAPTPGATLEFCA